MRANPIPGPRRSESWRAYVKRGMRALATEYPDARQRFAILAQQWRLRYKGAASSPAQRKRMSRNPGLTVFANPGRGELLSRRAYFLAYRHVDDGKDYKHSFKSGVCVELLPDGSVRLYGARGQRLWKDFG